MVTKKVSKKVVKKPAKKAVTKKTAKLAKVVKKPAKKPAKKAPAKKPAKKDVAVKAVADSTGVVTVRSVDDPGSATSAPAAVVKPSLDPETGVVTMVPSDED